MRVAFRVVCVCMGRGMDRDVDGRTGGVWIVVSVSVGDTGADAGGERFIVSVNVNVGVDVGGELGTDAVGVGERITVSVHLGVRVRVDVGLHGEHLVGEGSSGLSMPVVPQPPGMRHVVTVRSSDVVVVTESGKGVGSGFVRSKSGGGMPTVRGMALERGFVRSKSGGGMPAEMGMRKRERSILGSGALLMLGVPWKVGNSGLDLRRKIGRADEVDARGECGRLKGSNMRAA